MPDSFLIQNSENVWVDTLLLLRKQDYNIDYLNGYLNLKYKPIAGDSIKIQYEVLPYLLQKKYRHRIPVRITTEANKDSTLSESHLSLSARQSTQMQHRISSDLKKSGSIVRGVSVGSNQGLQVDSGLRMQISGHLTKDVEVVASLTDQNTPIQPEGNTQTLNEIDKVFIQVKGPEVEATFGDINLSLTGSEFTNYNRKLEGIVARGDFENSGFTASAAVSRGQFITNEFSGREGIQGPYQLHGENNNINILVIAGTEKVWVDGEPMTRGENQDYVTEYGNGQITFTRNRLITADSRIIIDFQFSDESFQRNYFAVQGNTDLWNDKINLSTTFIRESDARNNPLNLTLSDHVLNILESAGDSVAIIPGDTLVTQGQGAYIKDSLGVFIYVGPKNGNYNVRFSFFGPGQGDYRNFGFGRFEYVGENNGDYKPFIILPKAKQHNVIGFNVDLQPATSFKINSELAFSQFDQNVYSAIDDNDNQGSAYTIKLNFQPEKFQVGNMNLGRLNFSGKVRRKSSNFHEIDRTTIAEFNRYWNIASVNNSAHENIIEAQGQYFPVAGVGIRGGLGRLAKSTLLNSNRWELQTQLERKNLPKIDYFIESINREEKASNAVSDWLRHKGTMEYGLKLIKPRVAYEGEIKKDTQSDSGKVGFRFDSYTGGLVVSPNKFMNISARYNIRDDKDRIDGEFTGKSVAKTQFYSLDLREWHAITLAANYTHRVRDFNDASTPDTRTDLADIKVSHRPAKGWVRSNFNYQISNTQIARQEEVFVEVEEGNGNFRFNEELNEFEPDAFGKFVRRLFATNDFVPVVELRFGGDVRLSPANLFKTEKASKSLIKNALFPITSATFFRIDERSGEKDVKKIYLLNPSALQNDSTTIFGSLEFRQDIYLWENKRDLSLRYRFRSRNELNNQYVGGGQEREVQEHGFRLINQISNKISSQIDFTDSKEDRLFQSITREDRKVRSNKLELDLVYRPKSVWEFGLKSLYSFNKDIVLQPNTKANLFSFSPRLRYSLSNKGRIQVEVDWTKVDVSPKDRLIPFELTDGNRAGSTWRWNVGADYRVSGNVQMSLSYFGRSEPDRPETQHVAKVEMRAFF